MSYHCAELLSRIECPLRYAILGNHDVLVSAAAVTDALLTHGIPVLANSSVPLEREGQRLWLAGIKDALEERPDLATALPAGRSPTRNPLSCWRTSLISRTMLSAARLTSFSPDIPTEARFVSRSCPRSFSRHMGTKYVQGLFRLDDGMQLYVNRGIGAVNLPFRFRCPARNFGPHPATGLLRGNQVLPQPV